MLDQLNDKIVVSSQINLLLTSEKHLTLMKFDYQTLCNYMCLDLSLTEVTLLFQHATLQ